jgi:nucleotide-binding universal stress UspA family protein
MNDWSLRLRHRGVLLIFAPHSTGSGSASLALLDELKEENCDFAVLGYHHRRTIGEVVFGTTAKHLATNSPCDVVLSIPPRK